VKVKRPKRPVDRDDWREHINRRLRAEFIPGAEERSRKDVDEVGSAWIAEQRARRPSP
jgi:hypothetical protein